MDVKKAVCTAKEYVGDLFADEELFNVGLEEVDFDGAVWKITIGFSRSWDRNGSLASSLAGNRLGRSYKVLRIIDETGEVDSLKDRVLKSR